MSAVSIAVEENIVQYSGKISNYMLVLNKSNIWGLQLLSDAWFTLNWMDRVMINVTFPTQFMKYRFTLP